MQVAKTILDQMGGMRRIALMTGARDFTDIGNGVKFSFPQRMRSLPNHMIVKLLPSDTYRVEFWRIYPRSGECREISSYDGVYCDMLIDLFEKETGLYLVIGDVIFDACLEG